MIKSFDWIRRPDTTNHFLTMEVDFKKVISDTNMLEFVNRVVDILAARYAEEHGDEILKRIHEQTTDARVIQKVVANLRKELREDR